MKAIINYLSKFKEFNNIFDDKKVIHCENDESFAFLLLYEYTTNPRPLVIVLENLLACQNMYTLLNDMLHDKIFTYSVDEINKYTSLATSPEMELQRIYVLNKLIENEPIIVLTHTMAIKRLAPLKSLFIKKTISLKIDDEIKINDFINKLIEIGYKNVFKVTQAGEFSYRGGVVDVFSLNYNNPVRFEFFDTIIDSIRFFDATSQRTISTIKKAKIIPATEFLVTDLDEGIDNLKKYAIDLIKSSANNLKLEGIINDDIEQIANYNFNEAIFKYYSFFNCYSTLKDYIDGKQVIIVNEDKIKANEQFIEDEYTTHALKDYEEGYCLKNLHIYESFKDFKDSLKNINMVSTDVANTTNDYSFIKILPFDFNFDLLYKDLMDFILSHYTIYIGLESAIHYNTLKDYFLQKDVNFYEIDESMSLKEGINLLKKDLNIGLDFTKEKLLVIGENEIFKKRFKSTISMFSRYKNAITIESVNDLSIGDYLVHEHYGIGIYKGIETILNNGIHRDYIKIEYKNSDELYLPLEQFKLVRKYVSKEGAAPKINKLGSKEWEKTKAKINERVNEIAEKLVSLYTLRSQNEGFSFLKDDDLQEAFENDFPYELTLDQKTVLKEIKDDMESNYIMDRLLIGDVGFGKTEIAFRAAFKAINSGKQVAMLTPTTLLSRQHYITALDRFKNFGVRIALLSRQVSTKDETRILKELKDGKIDFIIGTHRLLSKDIFFHDLGLLIIDEEHKFGVEHKERIKEMKQTVDVLTLSATPIPRTLQMALTGVRGMSSINTPIDNRMPVQTYVIRKENHAIKDIIERELARGGQVYYLNNNIERLPNIALNLKSLVKNAKIAIAHGKMSSEQTEDVMEKFISKEYNILLCTTIIENGIDIENVNTIIVDNADCFGLSQLYQIKGRVGRSNKIAYAYLMYNPNKELTDIAKKRLQTIKEFTSLGSGYKIAMRDLITRGAGDILGAEQSGFIESVGIDMFIEMLNKAIVNKKLEKENKVVEEEKKLTTNTMLSVDAYIPQTYFNNDYEKIDLYKRIDKVHSFLELQSLKEELVDETGHLPESIALLFEKKKLDMYILEDVVESYTEYEQYVLIKLSKTFMTYNGVGVKIFDAACKVSNQISLKFQHDHIECQVRKVTNWLSIINEFLSILYEIKKQH